MNTIAVPTGAHGTIDEPWIGDTYTVLEHDGHGRIAGWIFYTQNTWYTVYATRPGRDLEGWAAPDITQAWNLVTAASGIPDPDAPQLARDTFEEAHTAIDTIWTLDYPTTTASQRTDVRARVARNVRAAVSAAEDSGGPVILSRETAAELLDLIDY